MKDTKHTYSIFSLIFAECFAFCAIYTVYSTHRVMLMSFTFVVDLKMLIMILLLYLSHF